ncbi:MAG: hypothetical protein M3Z37_00675 [Candidatus Eremiobacteraeota bacterium]|nr:hypothetical protein [Candidatus Eremiobacteraeota bacterium]
MSEPAFGCVEEGLRFATLRAAVLAADTANARTPGFQPVDVEPSPSFSADGVRFAARLHETGARGTVGVLQFSMAAQGRNAVRFHALADQERAMLHELRLVAQEARR